MHLDGRPHKKKEEMLKRAGAVTSGAGQNTSSATAHSKFYCQLCDVPCANADIYAAHMRGTKHTKVGVQPSAAVVSNCAFCLFV